LKIRRLGHFFLWGSLIAAIPRPAMAVLGFTADPGLLNFGNMQLQQRSNETTITLHPFSNEPAGWTLFMEAAPFTHVSRSDVAFPADAFTCRFMNDYPGTEYIAPGGAPVPQRSTWIYVSATPGECASSPCSYEMAFQLKVPPMQVAGQYRTTLIFTIATNE
jgi:hypothetical protein